MSTFNGQLKDPVLNFIAIDHFGSHLYACEVFMLSHHHCDHMNGIYAEELANLINESCTKLVYCSPLTAHFLRKNRYCSIRDDKIIPLDIYKPMRLEHDQVNTDINVTFLPAAHCPGSVMFLIEYESKRILYTGDIRLTLSDLKNLVGTITNTDGSAIGVDDLYLDTTFAVRTRFENFPSREDSEQVIIEFIRESLRVSPGRKIVLDIRAKFGYESLFIALRRAFKKSVMVHEDLLACYEDIEEMRDHVIGSRRCRDDEWLIHACRQSKNCVVSQTARIIRPCALGFVSSRYQSDIMVHQKYKIPYKENALLIKVFYATHCSLNELRDIVEFLKPKKVYPTVVVDQSPQEILSLIDGAGENVVHNNIIPDTGSLALSVCRKRNHEESERRRQEARRLLELSP